MALKKEERREKFKKTKEEVVPHPTPSEESLSHIGIKQRHRRTQKELLESKRDEAMSRFSDTSNPLFIPIIKAPFKAWADTNKLPELALKEDEVQELALPITRLIEFYLPKMPIVGYIWMSLGLSVMAVMSPRMAVVNKIKKEKTKETPLPEKTSDETPASQKFPTPEELRV